MCYKTFGILEKLLHALQNGKWIRRAFNNIIKQNLVVKHLWKKPGVSPVYLFTTLHIHRCFRPIPLAPYILFPRYYKEYHHYHRKTQIYQESKTADRLPVVTHSHHRYPDPVPSAPFHQNLSKTIRTSHWSDRESHCEFSWCRRPQSHSRGVGFNGYSWCHSCSDDVGFFGSNICHGACHSLCAHEVGNCDGWSVEVWGAA